jgi:hypothetical protein
MKRVLFTAIIAIALEVPSVFCCTVVEIAAPVELPRNFRVALTHSAKPLQMTLSILDYESGKLIRQVATNAEGIAEIRNLKPGMYRITSPVSDYVIKVTAKRGTGDLHIEARFDRAPIEVTAVSGIITDATGAVMPGATVVLERMDASHSPAAVGTSDASGSILLNSEDGEYVLRVSRKGFQTAVVPLRIIRTGRPGFTLTLQVANCMQSSDGFTIKLKE